MKDKKKILHFIDELRIGGAQTHLKTVIREMQRNHNFTHVIVGLLGSGELTTEFGQMGLEVVNLNLAEAVRKKRFLQISRSISSLLDRENPDLVEAHLTWSRLLALPVARWKGYSKTISYEHGDIYFKAPKWRVLNFLGQFFAERMIVVSEALKKWVMDTHRVSANRITVLHNCVDPRHFKISDRDSASRSDFSIEENDFAFCAVGTLGAGVNKRIDVCIRGLAEASRKLDKPAHLLVCGDGPLRKELEELAVEQGVGNEVHFLGTRQDVPDILNLSDAFCHSAPFEPFGIVCIEAMLLGLPVIVPNSGGIQEIVQNNITGLSYKSEDSTALSEKMIRLVESADLRKDLGEKGKAQVLANFTAEQYANRLVEIYDLGD